MAGRALAWYRNKYLVGNSTKPLVHVMWGVFLTGVGIEYMHHQRLHPHTAEPPPPPKPKPPPPKPPLSPKELTTELDSLRAELAQLKAEMDSRPAATVRIVLPTADVKVETPPEVAAK